MQSLRYSLGVSRRDNIRNEYFRGTAQVQQVEEKSERQGRTCVENVNISHKRC